MRSVATMLAAIALSIGSAMNGLAQPFHKTSETVDYKCIFNHELLIVSHKKDNNREYIQSFIEKLKDTDVDAVMCCPEMWRTQTFPSEVDPTWKTYKPGRPLSKFPSYDRMMTYLHAGGDPVRDTLDACRTFGKDFFVSYRMNDQHYVQDLEWPCHNDFWRDHPEYWLADSNTSPYKRSRDDVRLHNYLLAPVRDYYYAILEELCTKYDVDGVELDVQRFPRFFHNDKIAEGTKAMTAFVKRIRDLIDRIGAERGKSIKLCVRVPETVAKCEAAGLDVIGWDAAGLVDMINVSSFYIHTMELGIEEFQARTTHAKIYGEMNYVTYQNSKAGKYARRYTTFEIYRASALNLFHRGVDGLSLFNYDYVPAKARLAMAEGLKRITDIEYLKTVAKNYAVYPGFGTFRATNQRIVELTVADDTTAVKFDRAVLRIETQESCTDLQIGVWLNGTRLDECKHKDVELFPPVAHNAAYAERDAVKFYAVPLDRIVCGGNRIEIRNLDKKKGSCKLFSLELALYR